MLTYTEPVGHQLPKIDAKIKPKTIILGASLVLGLLFYSQSIKQPKLVELSTEKQSPSYTKWVESLADSYQLKAEGLVVTPGNSCFRRLVNDCLEQLKPEKPKQFDSLDPDATIRSDLRQLGYQVRMDAIKYAQEKAKDLKSNSRIF